MKPILLLPPASAILIAGGCLMLQRQSLSSLENGNAAVAAAINVARDTPARDSDTSLATRISDKNKKPASGAPGAKTDWKKMAAAFGAINDGSGMPDMRAMMEMQKKLLGMSAEELIASLDEIDAAGLSEKEAQQLQAMFLQALIQKDPRLALEHFSDKLGGGNMVLAFTLSEGLRQWAAKDSTAAVAWMDGMVEAGKFDGKSLSGRNSGRLRFEAALVQNLISTDPAEAARRINALPEDQRSELFQQGMFYSMKPGSEKAMADLIRTTVPEKSRNETLASTTNSLVMTGGYEKVGTYLDQIDASADERAAIVLSSISARNRWVQGEKPTVEETRAWIVRQVPDDAERLTGEALGQMAEKQDYAALAAKVTEYQRSSGKDDGLVAFLNSEGSMLHKEEALKLVDQIADATTRDQLRATLEASSRTPKDR